LFTDIHMPGTMDGLALAHHTPKHWPWIGLLVTSARPHPDHTVFPEQSRFVAKPYQHRDVICHIRELAAAGLMPPKAATLAPARTDLIVDDEPTVRMLITEVLEGLGCAAIEVADANSALKVLQSNVRIDLLITDVGLPGSLTGLQMARIDRPDLKVLCITGYPLKVATRAAVWKRPCIC
jgi:CheY-like chemotaxis protein